MELIKSDASSAVIVLHEIYGINRHISEVCQKYYDAGYDVFCPNLISRAEPFGYMRLKEAYDFFQNDVGDKAYIQLEKITERIRLKYKRLFLVGFSVGATIAWIVSESGLYDGIVSYYGSRIRDNLHIQPKCRSLLIFAEQETSFVPKQIEEKLKMKTGVTVHILQGNHGFLDSFSENYNLLSANIADTLTQDFLDKYCA